MDAIFSPEIFSAISIGLVIGLIVLLILQVLTSLKVTRLTSPIYDYIEARSQSEADRIVAEAKVTAKKITGDAQSIASALLAGQQSEIESRAKVYRETLDSLAAAARKEMESGMEKFHASQDALVQRLLSEIAQQGQQAKAHMSQVEHDLDGFTKAIDAQRADIHRVIEEGGKTALAGLTTTCEAISLEWKQRMNERIEALLAEAATDVKTYREARRRIVDEHIADLVTETSRVVLGKALTQKDHADLVENALKEAKSAGML